jgi:hypothetical protein
MAAACFDAGHRGALEGEALNLFFAEAGHRKRAQ